MTILIDLSVAGVNTGPFNLYSDADGYTSAFATNITRQQLLDGYPAVVDAGTTNIKLQSLSDICPNDTILPVNATTSTTTTLNCSFIVNAQEITTTTTTTSTTTVPPSSVEWLTGDYPPIAYGSSPGDIINLSGTLEIIGNPVTFRAYAYIPITNDNGGVDTSIDIGNNDVGITSRYVDAVTPNEDGTNQYSTPFTLPAGIYDWYVLCTFSNIASVGGEGGIVWTQA